MPGCTAAVTIATLDEQGVVTDHDLSGAARAGLISAHSAATPLDADALERNGLAALTPQLDGLRHALSWNRSLGFAPGAQGLAEGVCGPIGSLTPRSLWDQTELGRLWRAQGSGELAIAIAPIEGSRPGHVVIAQIALAETSSLTVGEVASVLRAVVRPLARRVSVALGEVGSRGSTRGQASPWLTTREQVVLEHLALGKSVRQIAQELHRSPHTVHDHVKALHRKLNASSRGELIARALGHLTACSRVRDRSTIVETRPARRPAHEPAHRASRAGTPEHADA